MARPLLITAAMAFVVLGVRPTAQARPDLTGKWIVADPLDRGIFGSAFTATQTAAALTIESTSSTDQGKVVAVASGVTPSLQKTLGWTFSPAAPSSVPQRWIYSMTAEEKRETHDRPAWVDNPDQSRMMWSYMESSTERAVWQGDLLIVVTRAYYRTHWPQHEPAEFPTETTTRLSLSLDGANRLTIERMVIADPPPSHLGARIDVPTVRRSVYLKAASSDRR